MAVYNLNGLEYVVSGKDKDLNFQIRDYQGRYGNDDHYDYVKFNNDFDFLNRLVEAAIRQGAMDKQREIVKVIGLDKMFRDKRA